MSHRSFGVIGKLARRSDCDCFGSIRKSSLFRWSRSCDSLVGPTTHAMCPFPRGSKLIIGNASRSDHFSCSSDGKPFDFRIHRRIPSMFPRFPDQGEDGGIESFLGFHSPRGIRFFHGPSGLSRGKRPSPPMLFPRGKRSDFAVLYGRRRCGFYHKSGGFSGPGVSL